MEVFQIIRKGNRLKGLNGTQSFKLERMIDQLIDIFYEANLALNLFNEEEKARSIRSFTRKDYSEEDRIKAIKEQMEIEKYIKEKYLENALHIQYDKEKLDLEIHKELNRLAWANGEVPQQFIHKKIFIHAKSFLFALDYFDRFLAVISKENGSPEALKDIHKKIKVHFPSLRGVRNTAHHMEDRIRGLEKVERNGKEHPLKLKPISTDSLSLERGALILNSLHGSKFGSTMADGHYGEVDVSASSMKDLQKILQEVIDAFSWNGKIEILPTPPF